MQKCKKMGMSWVKNLQNYMKVLNNEAKEELGWRSPFEVYYGRKPNELSLAGTEVPNTIETQVYSC